MVKKVYPNFHKSLMEESIYPSAKRRIKYEETYHSYIYRAGDFIYKIRKPRATEDNFALRERYALEALDLGKHWAPDVVTRLMKLYKAQEGVYTFNEVGEPAEFVLQSVQVSENFWLSKQMEKGKFSPTAVGRLARFLAERHAERPAPDGGHEAGRPEQIQGLAEEVFYQSKKYIGRIVPAPLLDMVSLPFFRFIEDHRKLFQRRQKKNRIVSCHGQFVPEHIYLKSREIFAISPLVGTQKYRNMDAANDLATITNALQLAGDQESQELLIKRYATAARDRDLGVLMPLFQTFQAIRMGLVLCEWLKEEGHSEEQRTEWTEKAHALYTLAGHRAARIGKS